MNYKLQQYSCKKFDFTPEQWRINLMAYNQETNDLFCAMNNRIIRYNTSQFDIQDPKVFLYIDVDSFNQIKIYDNKLFCVSHNCIVIIIDILTGQTARLTAQYPDAQDNSLWSLDISKQLLAVGSNSRKISIWSAKKLFQSINPAEQPILFKGSNYIPDDEPLLRYYIPAATNNIPCIKFTPCETYLGYGSIDCKFRIINVNSYLKAHAIKFDQYVWSIEYKQVFSKGTLEDYHIFAGQQSQINVLQLQQDLLKKLFVIKQTIQLYRFSNSIRIQQMHYIKGIDSLIVVPYNGTVYQIYNFTNDEQKFTYSKIDTPERQPILTALIFPLNNQIISFRMTEKWVIMEEIKYNEINQQIL